MTPEQWTRFAQEEGQRIAIAPAPSHEQLLAATMRFAGDHVTSQDAVVELVSLVFAAIKHGQAQVEQAMAEYTKQWQETMRLAMARPGGSA